MSKVIADAPEDDQLQMPAIVASFSTSFDASTYLLNRGLEQKHPLLAQLVTWRNSVDLFREWERRDFRDLSQNASHRSALSLLIGQGEYLLQHSRLQNLNLESIGLTGEMIESEIRALRDDLRITHEELISEVEAEKILGAFAMPSARKICDGSSMPATSGSMRKSRPSLKGRGFI
ncbi:MAG: hypothetical protein WDO13_12520 [Verrucomicrobiota bacterium]